MNEIAAAAAMSAVRSACNGTDGKEGQQQEVVVVGGVRKRAVFDFEDAEDAVKEFGGGAVEQGSAIGGPLVGSGPYHRQLSLEVVDSDNN